ncbi:MAG: cysteine desulfurase family protein [Rhodospirillales bacterium]
MTVYLDHNATTPLRAEAREAALRALDVGGNPSSVHAAGRAARKIIEDARETVAALLGARADEVVFTSGGTEAANLALAGRDAAAVIVSAVEHPCVLEAAPGAARAPVDADGVIDLGALEALLVDAPAETLVCVMAANNETGAVQPIADVIELAKAHGARVFVDAVQAAGRLDINFAAMGADYMSVSSHKLGGPAGAGALLVRDGAPVSRLVRGGGQERGLRAGTENLAGIAGFAAACAAVQTAPRAGPELRDALEQSLRAVAPDVVIFAEGRERLNNTTCFASPGVAGETALIALDLEGVCVSYGAACSSGKTAPSHVLRAMGAADDLAPCALRVSTGWTTTMADIEAFLSAFETVYARLAPRAPLAAVG